jgi:hypothetical protein
MGIDIIPALFIVYNWEQSDRMQIYHCGGGRNALQKSLQVTCIFSPLASDLAHACEVHVESLIDDGSWMLCDVM